MWSKKTALFAAAIFAAAFLSISAYASEAEDVTDNSEGPEDIGVTLPDAPVEDLGYDVSEEGFIPLRLGISATEHGAYVRGYEDGEFRPEEIMTRAEGAQMVYSLLADDPGQRVLFTDVARDAWYYDAVGVLAAGGAIPAGQDFFPDDVMSRGRFISILSAFFPDGEYDCPYSDVAPDSEFFDDIAKAAHYGWVSGFPDGSFRPERGISRAEAVTVLNRVLERSPDREKIDNVLIIPLFPDVSPEHWAYYQITEACLTHRRARGESERWKDVDREALKRSPGTTVLAGGELYYIGEEGYPLSDVTVGSLYFGPDGRYTSGDEEIDSYITEIISELSAPGMSREELLHAAYDHTRDSYSYLRRNYYNIGDTGWEQENARVMLETKRGNCYCYTAVFYYLSRQLGYEATAVSGVVGSRRSPHGWVEIDFDGVTNIFDTELEMSYRKKGVFHYDFYMMPYSDVPWQYVKTEE